MAREKTTEYTVYIRLERVRAVGPDEATDKVNRQMDRTGMRYYVENVERTSEVNPEREE